MIVRQALYRTLACQLSLQNLKCSHPACATWHNRITLRVTYAANLMQQGLLYYIRTSMQECAHQLDTYRQSRRAIS